MAARAVSYLSLNGRVSWPFLLLVVILALAFGLRLHGVDWDQGHGFHPDERDIYMRSGCMYDLLTEAPGHRDCGYVRALPDVEPGLPGVGTLLDADRSPLNPHWFPLGSILIYVMVFFRSIAELFTDISALDMRYIGRPLSALADVGSVFMVFVLGRRLYGQGVGLLAAGLTALAVIHIQNSHFYRPETFTVFFTLASFWAMLRMVERKRLRDSALLGLMLGLALAPKVTVLPLLAPLALVYWYRVLDEVDGRWTDVTPELVQRMLGHAAVAAVVAVAVFFVSAPYAFLDFGAFVSDLTAQTRMANTAGLWPFTVQYVDTPAFLYQIRQTSVWGLGLPLGVIAWLSIPFTAALAFASKRTRRADLLLLAWVVPSFLFLESFEVRFLRYVFPLMPFMIILGARMLFWLWDNSHWLADKLVQSGRSFGRYAPVAAAAVGVFVVAGTAFYSLAFQRVYAEDHPAITASQWINETVPRESAIVSDNHWDEFIPNLYSYNVWQYPVYEQDTPAKMDELATRLARSEYLVFYSSRPYASAARDPERFPLSNIYYQRLFNGDLGYRLERKFTSYPELAGVSFRDDAVKRAGLAQPTPDYSGQSSKVSLQLGYADDNVVGYDHPTVLLFRNQGRFSEESIRAQLSLPLSRNQGQFTEERPRAQLAAPLPQGESSRPVGLLLSDTDRAAQQAGGTFSDIVDRDSWTNDMPVLAWLLVVELIYLLALPLTMFIFRPLPDRGIVLARIMGLLGVSYIAWLLVSLGWTDFSRTAVYLGMGILALSSATVLAFKWREIRDFFSAHWRLFLIGEGLFLVAFLAFVALRYANPDLWHPFRGGEKPMELAYLNAVLRSTTLPPFDPWFAGGYLNYYYWGYFVISGIIRVTGMVPTTAFNLAVPMFFALTVTGAYSLVYNLTEGVRLRRSGSSSAATVTGTEVVETEWPVGPPGPARQGLIAQGLIAKWRPWLWSPVAAGLLAGLFIAVIGNLDGIVQIVQGTWYKAVDGTAFPPFDFWRSSRMLPPLDNFDPSPAAFWVPDVVSGASDVSFHITEFPFFTFLFADLHAHMMVIPFTLLVIGLGLNLVVGLRDGGRLWTVLAAAALAVALGSLWVVNSWDYPSYAVLVLGLLGLAVYFARGSLSAKVLLFGGLAVGVFAVSLLVFLPFHQSYETFNSGLDVSKWRTPVDRYLGVHGLFIFIAVTFLLVQSRDVIKSLVQGILERGRHQETQGLRWLRAALGLGLVFAVYMAIAGYWNVVMLLVFLMLAGVAGWRLMRSRDEDRPFAVVPIALVVMALLIAIGVDFVRVEGDIGRMNTFFKYYLEIWVLMSIAAAYMLWQLGAMGFLRRRWGWRSVTWVAVLAVLIGSSLIYTALGSRDRLSDRFVDLPSSLDGTAYMQNAVHFERDQAIELKWDQEAIRWLQDNVQGSPVVLEAHMEQYRWGSRIAIYTGLPTVLGWPWHQFQQRTAYDFAIFQRADDIAEIYNTTDVTRALDLLRTYQVGYMVVGDLERAVYEAGGLNKFQLMEEQGLLRQVFQNQGVSIYQRAW